MVKFELFRSEITISLFSPESLSYICLLSFTFEYADTIFPLDGAPLTLFQTSVASHLSCLPDAL